MPVSTNGGAQPRWSRDGREPFYVALDGKLMAVPMRFGNDGRTVEPGTPVELFPTRIGGALQGIRSHDYMVAADGRFLMNNIDDAPSSPLVLILNWKGAR